MKKAKRQAMLRKQGNELVYETDEKMLEHIASGKTKYWVIGIAAVFTLVLSFFSMVMGGLLALLFFFKIKSTLHKKSEGKKLVYSLTISTSRREIIFDMMDVFSTYQILRSFDDLQSFEVIDESSDEHSSYLVGIKSVDGKSLYDCGLVESFKSYKAAYHRVEELNKFLFFSSVK